MFAPAGMLLLAASWTVVTLPFTLQSGESSRKYLPAAMPGGIAVFDADGDGKLDIFFPNGAELPSLRKGPQHGNKLLRNLGAMKFADVTVQSGVVGSGYDIGASAADYDNDGDTDLLVCGLHQVTLYRNNGKGVFTDSTAAAGLSSHGRWAVAGAWFDMENDGDRDLFIVNYVRWDPASERTCIVEGKADFCHPKFYEREANSLLRNNGDGTFTDVSKPSGVGEHKAKGMSVAAADFDLDGFTDLFVTNDRMFNYLFRNRGNGRFEEVAFDAGVAAPASGNSPSAMGVAAADYDNDGDTDLVYTALRDETFPLYRNEGKLQFTEDTERTKLGPLTRPMAGWGVALADLDNDGWRDIAVARSDVLSAGGAKGAHAKEPVTWLRNIEGRAFATPADADGVRRMHRGLVAADLDDDGCMDLVTTALNEPARVLRNRCSVGAWLKVRVREPGVRVRVGTQWADVNEAVGYASSYAGPLHFGLGPATAVDVEVSWPDGHRRTLSQIRVGQTVEVSR